MTPKFQRILAFLMAMVAGSVMAGAIKSWSTGETLTAAQLNANFAHIHSLMVGGHGGRLVDADVSASANIATTKLADGEGIADAFVTVADACTASPCTMVNAFNVTSITRSGVGVYTVTLPFSVGGTSVQVTANSATAAEHCNASYTTGTTFTIQCVVSNTAAAADSGFSLTIHSM